MIAIIIIILLVIIAFAVAPDFMLGALKVIGYLVILAIVIGAVVAVVVS